MGQVIAMPHAASHGTEVTPTTPELLVAGMFAKLAAESALVVRSAQEDLAVAVCKSIVDAVPLLAEAPTGTGKTLAYLVGALAAQQLLERNGTPLKAIVVATATVALQSQILATDLPRLFKAGLIGRNDVALAKGRQRYFCINSATKLADKAVTQAGLFDETPSVIAYQHEEARVLLEHWDAKAWDGDVDTYGEDAPQSWPLVRADAETCLGSTCPHFDECPYFRARTKLGYAKLVIANHDLVLSDMFNQVRTESDGIFGKDFILVFDEAHHVPECATSSGSTKLHVAQSADRMSGAEAMGIWGDSPHLLRILDDLHANVADFDTRPTAHVLRQLADYLQGLAFEPGESDRVFTEAELSAELNPRLEPVLRRARAVQDGLRQALSKLKTSSLLRKEETKGVAARAVQTSTEVLRRTGQVVSGVSPLLDGGGNRVVWLHRHADGTLELQSSPLDAREVMLEKVWGPFSAVRPVLVSATLRDFEGFGHFQHRVGLDNARTLALSSPYPYHENVLRIIRMEHSPSRRSRLKWEAELLAELPQHVNPGEASLVLCSSYDLLKKVTRRLRDKLGHTVVLAQGSKSVRQLVRDHKERIDTGKGSVLCGVASLSEGLDLPGKYCTHVLILAIPFAPPNSPVEAAIRDRLGDDYFAQKSKPEAYVKLVQMVGRLMRRESDRGSITLFDTRLGLTTWGREMLRKLPPFRREMAPKKLRMLDTTNSSTL